MILNLSDFLPLLSAFTNLKRQYEIKFKEIRKVFYMFMFPNQKGIRKTEKLYFIQMISLYFMY